MLQTMRKEYQGTHQCQVPPAVMGRVLSLKGCGVLPVAGGEVMGEGLRVRVDRIAAFQKVLSGVSAYLKPPSQRQGGVVLNCPALHPKPNLPSPDTLTLGQLRTVLLTDHLGALLRRQGFTVSCCPVLPEDSNIIVFLRMLGVDWPSVPVSWTNDEREEKMLEALQNSPYKEREETDGGRRESEGKKMEGEKEWGTLRVNLKRVFQEEQLPGYDPSLGTCTVQRDSVSHLAQLDRATADCTVSTATAVHVTSCQDEFRQQQIAMLWRASGATVTQTIPGDLLPFITSFMNSSLTVSPSDFKMARVKKPTLDSSDVKNNRPRHLVCGPVKTPGSHLSAAQYLQLRRVQMKEASEMKYGEQVEGQTWDDIIKVMTSATVRFELLSTVHMSPVTLDVQREGSVSTKGPRGGVFVMYNCARLHTLFDSYERGMEKGLYPEIPEGSQLDFSALKEEGEWLLLFNYLIPFSELLDQSGQVLECDGGARVNLKTEQICKFLVSLSKDFSSYYNRVHVLGEPLPHLFNQMFCRLQLLRALRELYHRALDTLHLPPIRQL
ncbi:DALR anticodon-binding domain-containing protein 3 isoform X2 [Oncorhynchus tshawytscha]|uniref:DALR anticodon-binding domain-containing protein 3 isoform X2 n=1 Tax=Oncorhynchus tshawytscha TaxID=74940 RepID=UPI001C3D5817|nr:DALR anticodon-binding domain-containing protein 3 isoform X2 [Oncorhynchus tshawytscha]